MRFDWKDFLNLARHLNGEAISYSQEASLRTAVSRAYFAAFRHALGRAIERDSFEAKGRAEDHGRLREHFRNRKARGVATKLDRLNEWRGQADYDAEIENLDIMARTAIEEAQKVFDILK